VLRATGFLLRRFAPMGYLLRRFAPMGTMLRRSGDKRSTRELACGRAVGPCMSKTAVASEYALRVGLVACPFCREMFEKDEAEKCPVCGVGLAELTKLPMSDDAYAEDGVPRQPEYEPLPVTFLGRGRGPLALLAVCGLLLFFLPWIHTTMPDVIDYTGFLVARRLGWAWGAGVAWFVMIPTVVSRRSIMQMRGARVAASFLAAIPGITVALLLARPPHGGHGVPLRFTYEWPLFATLVASVLALAFAFRLGGRVHDIAVKRGNSAGQTLH
jgi:hypothetical protein